MSREQVGGQSGGAAAEVTVIIPTYNFGLFVEEAIRSALSQDVEGMEVIVVDDGSTDDTAERLARIDDRRLRTLRVEHGGVGAARNHGLRMARGRYIAFLDADDRWRPRKLERQLAILKSEPDVGFVFTNFVRFDDSGFHGETQFDLIPGMAAVRTHPSRVAGGHILDDDALTALGPFPQLPCWTQTMLVRAEVARGTEFPADMRLSQDLYYVLNIYRLARGAYIDEPLVEVRRHSGNSYRRAHDKLLPDIDAVARTLAVTVNPRERSVLQRRLGRAWLAAGYHFFWAGEVRRTIQASRQALRYPGRRTRALTRLLVAPLALFYGRLHARKATDFPSVRR